MIVWDGFKLIGLQISIVLLVLVGIYFIVCVIADKLHERRDRKNQEWWDKREREEREGEEE